MPSSPGCWARFEEVLAREFGDPSYFAIHQVTVESYAASHPAPPDPKATPRTALHLMTLGLLAERGADARELSRLHARMKAHPPASHWLEPPDLRTPMTVADVLAATTAAEHLELVRAWAGHVWAAWEPHHATIRAWVDESLG